MCRRIVPNDIRQALGGCKLEIEDVPCLHVEGCGLDVFELEGRRGHSAIHTSDRTLHPKPLSHESLCHQVKVAGKATKRSIIIARKAAASCPRAS